MLFMVRPMPAITEQTAKNQDGRDCNSKSHEVLRLRQDVKAHNPGAHRGEREAHHGCHSEFRRTWHRGAKRAQDPVIIRAEADAGHPANTRNVAPASSAIPMRAALPRATTNSPRCGRRTSRGLKPFAQR